MSKRVQKERGSKFPLQKRERLNQTVKGKGRESRSGGQKTREKRLMPGKIPLLLLTNPPTKKSLYFLGTQYNCHILTSRIPYALFLILLYFKSSNFFTPELKLIKGSFTSLSPVFLTYFSGY